MQQVFSGKEAECDIEAREFAFALGQACLVTVVEGVALGFCHSPTFRRFVSLASAAGGMEDEGRDLQEYDTVAFRTLSGAASSLLAGTILGAITATWQDVPAVERNVAMPALRKTGRMMGYYGILFCAIGGTFSLVEAVTESARAKKDVLNGVVGGFAAGSILGARAGRVPVGLGAGAAMAAVSAFVDLGGQKTFANMGREYLPYPSEPTKS